MTAFCPVIVYWYAVTCFTLFNGVAFADEAGLIGVGQAPRLANGVATQTAHVIIGAKISVQIFHLFANATKLHHLAYVYFASIVVVGYAIIEIGGSHRINICQVFF